MALSSALAMVGCSTGGSGNSSTSGSNTTAKPTFSPGAGTYVTSQTVTIADTTPGAVLYCTTDGSVPTTSSPVCSQPTTIFKTQFLQAIAVAPGNSPSTVAAAAYTITPNATPAPTFSPGGGTFSGTQQVTINDTLAGANIFYTVDGTTPTANSTVYTGAITISKNTTLSAIATGAGLATSPIVTATYTIQSSLPAPVVSGISPASASAGAAAFTLTVNGSNFASGATVLWNGTGLTTTFVSGTQLTAAVPANLITTAGSANVSVSQGSGVSGASTFTINSVAPTISGLSPASTPASGASFTLTVNGTNFVSGATVNWNGTPLTTTFVSTTQLTAAVPATLIATAGTASVSVVAPVGTSAPATFTISVGAPTISSLSPTSATAGGAAFTLTVNGANFIAGSVVNWAGTALTTTFVSATQLTAAVPANLITNAGAVSVTVTTSSGTSPASTFTINPPAPTISTLSPTSVPAGGSDFTLTVNGTNFVSGATVSWNGAALTTTYVSPTQLTAAVTASLIGATGSANITVTTPGGTSSMQAFTIAAPNAPTISTLAPDSATAGDPAFTLTVTGANYIASSVVNWNGVAQTTTFVSATQVTASVPANLIASAGTPSVTVTGAAGSVSAASTFTINPALPTISSLSPNSATPGSAAFTLTVTGTNFNPSAVVNWGNTALTTTYVSATQVTAAVPANLLTTAGQFGITVTTNVSTTASTTFTVAFRLSGMASTGTATPLKGASVQLWAAGATGYAQGATQVGSPVTSDMTTGTFSIPYDCSTLAPPNDQIYLVATGGDSGSGSNSKLVLMSALGSCSGLNALASVAVNEATTVASAYSLAQFAAPQASGTGIIVGTSSTNAIGLANAMKTVPNLVSLSAGTVYTITPSYQGAGVVSGGTLNSSYVPQARINTLANMLNGCTSTSGSGCGALFTAATPASGITPADTLQAVLNIAQHPGTNVGSLYAAASATGPFQPALTGTTAPGDWTLAVTFEGAGMGVQAGEDPLFSASLTAMAIDATGNIWLTAVNQCQDPNFVLPAFDAIFKYDNQGNALSPASTASNNFCGGYQPMSNGMRVLSGANPLFPSGSTYGIAVDLNSNIWVTTNPPKTLANGGQLAEFASDGSVLLPSAQSYNFLKCANAGNLLVDGLNNLWYDCVANTGGGIGENSAADGSPITGQTLDGTKPLAQLGVGGGIALDLTGSLWAVGNSQDADLSHLYQFTAAGSSSANPPVVNQDFSTSGNTFTYSVAADGAGNIFSVSNTPGFINLVSPTSKVSTLPYPIPASATGVTRLAIDGAGNVWGAAFAGDAINVVYASSASYLVELSNTGTLLSPKQGTSVYGYTGTGGGGESQTILANFATFPIFGGLAVDSSGNLWVANGGVNNPADLGGGGPPGQQLIKFIGLAAPVATPSAAALQNNTLGSRP